MRLPRTASRKARIEIIPMIDTMFFLLVFFMLASLSMTHQFGVPVNLPRATGVAEPASAVITVSITETGQLYYNKVRIASPRELALRLLQQQQDAAPLTVIINADRGVRHGRVIEVLDVLQQSGLAKLAKIAISVSHSKS